MNVLLAGGSWGLSKTDQHGDKWFTRVTKRNMACRLPALLQPFARSRVPNFCAHFVA